MQRSISQTLLFNHYPLFHRNLQLLLVLKNFDADDWFRTKILQGANEFSHTYHPLLLFDGLYRLDLFNCERTDTLLTLLSQYRPSLLSQLTMDLNPEN